MAQRINRDETPGTLLIGAKAPTRVGRLIHPAAALRWRHPDVGDFASFNGYHAVVLRNAGEEPLNGRIPNSYRTVYGESSDTAVSGAFTQRKIDLVELADAYMVYLGAALHSVALQEEYISQYESERGAPASVSLLVADDVALPVPEWMATALYRFYRRCVAEHVS